MIQEEHKERSYRRRRRFDIDILVYAAFFLLALAAALMIVPRAGSEEEPEPVEDLPAEVIIRYATRQEQEEHDQETLVALARTVWGEARGCTTTEQAAVVWCVLNRVDRHEWPDDPLEVVEQPGQFPGYDPEHPVWSDILALVEDVMDRWELEKTAVGDVGRVLPREYVFFEGDGSHNYFRAEFRGNDTWDWSLGSPYEQKGS